MFRGLINDAKVAAGSVVSKYAVRASVAVPFMIALGFGTAGLTLWLIEHYGARDAYFIVAIAFATLGLIAAILVQGKEQDAVVAETKVASVDTASVATEAVAAAAEQLPLAMLGNLLASHVSPESIVSLVKGLGRNAPLVLLVASLGLLLWPNLATSSSAATMEGSDDLERARATATGSSANGAFYQDDMRHAA